MAFLTALKALTTFGGLVLDVWGATVADSEEDAARRRADKRYQQEFELTSRLRLGEERRAEEAATFGRAESRRTWKWKEEDRNYQRGRDFATNLQGIMDKEVDFKNNLVNIFRERGR